MSQKYMAYDVCHLTDPDPRLSLLWAVLHSLVIMMK